MSTTTTTLHVHTTSDMTLNVQSDASYIYAGKGPCRAGGYFFLRSMPRNGDPIQLNSNIIITCAILKFVVASSAEAELSALFLNTKEARVVHLLLAELGHPQPPTPIRV